MKKNIRIILIAIGVIVGVILFDSIQALVFDNNPIIGIDSRCCKRNGILVDTYYCDNGKKNTVIKGFSYSCSYNGGNYTLIDETKNKLNFSCAEVLQSFYEDEKYIYYWECMKNKYMIVKYEDGFEETISDALIQKHIGIEVLNKFDIDYIKEEK